MTLIALDLGTSFIKGALLDLDRLSLSNIRRLPFPGLLAGLPTLFHEVDPLLVVATVRRLIEQLLAITDDCSGIVFCTQMHGLVLCGERGKPLSNLITWQDQRVLTAHPSGVGSHFERLQGLISPLEQQQLGNELQPSRPLCTLYWMAENGKLPDQPAYPAALTDFVIANLCATSPLTEPTNAAAYCAFDLTSGQWHTAVIERLGLAHLRWPAVRAFGSAAGELCIDGRVLHCYSPVGDHQCALVGAFLGERELSLNISTGSQATFVTPTLTLGNYQTRPFFDGCFINTITGVPAGRALNALVNLLTEIPAKQGMELADPWHTIAEAVAQVEESAQKQSETSSPTDLSGVFSPDRSRSQKLSKKPSPTDQPSPTDLSGVFSPDRSRSLEETPPGDLRVNLAFYDSLLGKEGHIQHMREENITVGHLFHAAFQNMADNYYASALRLSPEKAWDRIAFSGGLAQKLATLRTIIQRKFQTNVRTCVSNEDTLLGLLALALVASGRKSTVAEAIKELQQNYRE